MKDTALNSPEEEDGPGWWSPMRGWVVVGGYSVAQQTAKKADQSKEESQKPL